MIFFLELNFLRKQADSFIPARKRLGAISSSLLKSSIIPKLSKNVWYRKLLTGKRSNLLITCSSDQKERISMETRIKICWECKLLQKVQLKEIFCFHSCHVLKKKTFAKEYFPKDWLFLMYFLNFSFPNNFSFQAIQFFIIPFIRQIFRNLMK